jgi:Uncharacterized protein conserved in bacteria (DUF2188)
MAQDVYEPVLQEYHWKTSYRGEYYGVYATQKEAIRAAIESAQKAGAINPDGVQVRVHGSDV